ncbi:hypothetical protein HMI54_002844 [Coelomomyces lativittatus]|nr:hypothetical protein HMI56_000409 [Coelomomyces lativittatus]KAJ1507707.1 hypothetical protein HMI55_000673 [Coelomomyces lativittatus]KAJ1508890.1 hypothetical protein HMI54_002844 [Coelomomyces lativittatus]
MTLKNLIMTLDEGRMITCRLPRRSALTIELRQSFKTEIRTIFEKLKKIENRKVDSTKLLEQIERTTIFRGRKKKKEKKCNQKVIIKNVSKQRTTWESIVSYR